MSAMLPSTLRLLACASALALAPDPRTSASSPSARASCLRSSVGGAEAEAFFDQFKSYPALTDDEIVGIFDKVPVFALADAEGNAAVVAEEGDESGRLEFFLDAQAAMQRARQLSENSQADFRLSAQSLGRAYVAYEKSDAPVAARFLADPRELAAARQLILSGAGALVPDQNMTAAELREAYLVVDESARFGAPHDVPLFCIPQLVLQQGDGPPLRSWFFSMADLLEQWKAAATTEADYAEGEVQILSLREVITAMRTQSTTDQRASLFIPTKSALQAIGVKV
ncbi:hypothetical protein M885DRAFT_507019 [Pelagophyceae sp. CCMP2097]|nr:hypothetical protein M885DRAFT_507019 [Pelagophyceae sp. CCMP2097]